MYFILLAAPLLAPLPLRCQDTEGMLQFFFEVFNFAN